MKVNIKVPLFPGGLGRVSGAGLTIRDSIIDGFLRKPISMAGTVCFDGCQC